MSALSPSDVSNEEEKKRKRGSWEEERYLFLSGGGEYWLSEVCDLGMRGEVGDSAIVVILMRDADWMGWR